MRKGLTAFTVVVAMSLVGIAATVQNVVGTITDLSYGEPIPAVRLSFYDAVNAELLASATTDAHGQYDTGSVPAGSYRLLLSSPYWSYFLGANGVYSLCAGTVVSVPASTTTVLDAAVLDDKEGDGPFKEVADPGSGDYGVFGIVVDDESGAPLPGIRVNVLRASDAELLATTHSGLDGSFSIAPADIPAGRVRVRFTDPGGSYGPEFHGAEADAFCTATIFTVGLKEAADVALEKIPPAQLTQQLAETVESYGLSPTVETLLGTSLTQVRKLLSDNNPGNDAAACGQLASFSNRVDVQERKGELSAAQASELKNMATNVRGTLGCQ